MTKDEVVDFLTSRGFVQYASGYWCHFDGPQNSRASVNDDLLVVSSVSVVEAGKYDLDQLEVINGQLYTRVAPRIFA